MMTCTSSSGRCVLGVRPLPLLPLLASSPHPLLAFYLSFSPIFRRPQDLPPLAFAGVADPSLFPLTEPSCPSPQVFAQLFFAAARGLPIYRGRSMDQPTFRAFCSKARAGGWCHIFPEGRIWQPWKLEKESRRLGPLRPGVGKLIANCQDAEPVVLPFYHTGMHRVLPQVPDRLGAQDCRPLMHPAPWRGQARRAASPHVAYPHQ